MWWGSNPRGSVSNFSATIYRPVTAILPSLANNLPLTSFLQQNLKGLSDTVLCLAIDTDKLVETFYLNDVNEVHDLIVVGLRDALDHVAPSRGSSLVWGLHRCISGRTLFLS